MKPDDHKETDDSSRSGISAGLLASAALAFLAIAGVYVFCATFSQMRAYDDVGCLMISVQGFLEGNPLYDSVATYYGPVYYFYEWLVHGFASIPLTHDATGVLCGVHLLLAATILAAAGWRLTRSLPVAFLVFAQSVVHLEAICGEPGHPQELVVLLLALAALVAAGGTARRSTLPILGGIGACLVLTKINVGLFWGVALLLSLLCYTPPFRSRRMLFLVMMSLTAFLPLVLMRQHFAEAWTRHYCWQAWAGTMAAGIVAQAYAGRREIGLPQWTGTGMAFAGLSGIILAIVLATGSSVSAVVYCLLKGPASFANACCVPLHVEHCSWSAAGALALAIAAVALRGRMDRWLVPISVGKGVYGVIGALILVHDPRGQLGYLLPWVWLLLVPLRHAAPKESAGGFPRCFLCLAAVWEGLQAYPVAGTQTAIGTFLAVLVYSICAADAIQALAPLIWAQFRPMSSFTRPAAVMLEAGFLVVLFAVFVFKWTTPLERWRHYAAVPPLDLRGAHLVRPDPAQANTYRMLTQYIQTECDTFVALPGLNSLYFWTDKRPPTYINISGEGVMPSDSQQDQIIAAMRRARRPLALESETKWAPGVIMGDTKKGPLPLFISSEYREIQRLARFRILAPKNVFVHESVSSH